MIGFDDLLMNDEFMYTWLLDKEKERKKECLLYQMTLPMGYLLIIDH